MTNETLPVVAYIRESTGRQSMYGYKPEVQKKEIGKYCKRLNFEIVQVFEDSGSGGDIEKRPKFQEMIRYVKARGIRFIVPPQNPLRQEGDEVDPAFSRS